MWGRKRVPEPPAKGVIERLEELEDNQGRLERRFDKIKGEFDASIRRQRQLERENDDLRDELNELDQVDQAEGE